MNGFNAIETVSALANSESQKVVFSNPASIGASQIMVDNEGLHTVFIGIGDEAVAPLDAPVSNAVPVLPMQSKVLAKDPGKKTISIISESGESKVFISSGQSF